MTPQPNNSEWLETILRKVYNQGFDDRQPSGTEPFNRMTIDEAKAASQFRINTIVAERERVAVVNELSEMRIGYERGLHGASELAHNVLHPLIDVLVERIAQLQPKEGEKL